MKKAMSNNEKKVLYGLVRHPSLTDTELAEELSLAQSTVTTMRHRLKKEKMYKDLWIPMLNRVGCELLVLIHTNFNPIVDVEARAERTRKTIEVFEEIFFSMGETQKGFSLSMAEDYTAVGKINDKRTETFAAMDLLEKEYPEEVVFPFELSVIHRFFNFAPLLEREFGMGEGWGKAEEITFPSGDGKLSGTDRTIYMALVENPGEKDGDIGKLVGVSRHTVALHRKRLDERGHIRRLRIPDMKRIGVSLLVFHHVKFNSHNAPDIGLGKELQPLLSPPTIFMISRKFEMIRICAYPSYEVYKKDKSHMISYLRKRDLLAEYPLHRVFAMDGSVIIKDFAFAPLVRKFLDKE
ncbi:MAG: hypothetical protein KAT70_08870 [Thermoplasmata archaeon]|nr:hypothetical protein [Thermoplasmata archaeon]